MAVFTAPTMPVSTQALPKGNCCAFTSRAVGPALPLPAVISSSSVPVSPPNWAARAAGTGMRSSSSPAENFLGAAAALAA